MVRRSGSFRSNEGLTLHTLSWLPAGDPAGLVVMSHGYAEHSARYDSLAAALVRRGLAVHALDFPGHGRSAGRRGWLGSFDGQVADLGSFVHELRSHEQGLRCGLFGHSVGGTTAAALCAREPDIVDALALNAPYLRHGRPTGGWLAPAVRIVDRLFPAAGISRVDPEDLSRLPTEVEAYRKDPLVFHGKVNARAVAQFLRGFETLAAAERIVVPLLVTHGSEDRIADPAATRELVERVSSTDVTFELMAGVYHEGLNDLGREQLVERIVDWLAARLLE